MSDTIDRLNGALEDRYRIERELGEGGMATVYLAADVRHERRVALKVLKPELTAVVGAERFLAEIRTTANLQHPHILPLFDSGEADGFLFYVMPYVEGETLRDRLDRERQLPVEEAVRIASAVADALHAAHEQGVVHRDVKPANVLLSRGQPLVADFGIALAVSAGGGGRLTETGLSLGTPYYMSPEQATGDQSVGPASDLFALGCVLHEMLVGEPPYTGSTAQAVLGKILQAAPVSAKAGRPSVPENVDAAIRKALERVPADRFTSAAGLAAALADAGFRHAESAAGAPSAPPPARARVAPTAAAWTVAAVATALALWGWLRPEAPQPVRRLHLDVPASRGAGRFAAVSPDGSRIVYVGPDRQLFQRSLGALDAQPIPGARPARDPFFSPDGRYVAFNYGEGDTDRIATVALDGGAPVVLGDPEGGISVGGAWAEDGFVYYVTGNNPGGRDPSLVRVPSQGGSEESVATSVVVVRPTAIEGRSDRLLVVDRSGQVGVGVLDLETGEVAFVEGLEDAFEAYYAAGFVFWVTTGGALSAAEFDPGGARLTSVPVTLAQGVGRGGLTVSKAGVLVYREATVDGGRAVPGWIDREGRFTELGGAAAELWSDFEDARISPDGRYVALETQRGAGQTSEEERQIVIQDLERGSAFRLTFEGRLNRYPRWMPGREVAYVSVRDGRRGIRAQPFDRSGPERVLFETEHEIAGFDVSSEPGAPLAVVLVPLSEGSAIAQGIHLVERGGGAARPFVATRFSEGAPAISPDGRWLAYQSDETGRMQVYVQAFPGGGRPWPVGSEISQSPSWNPGRSELFYAYRNGLMALDLEIDDEVRVVSETPVAGNGFGFAGLSRRGGATYDVAPDGRVLTFVFAGGADASDPALPVVVLNVFEEIRERLEAGRVR